MPLWRVLLLVVLGLAMGGFGLCSLCGGVMGLSTLADAQPGGRDLAWLIFGFSAVGALLAWGCGWLFVRLRRRSMPE